MSSPLSPETLSAFSESLSSRIGLLEGDVRRLENLRGRVAALEEALKSRATKEDVANAKLWLITTWVGISLAAIIGVASILVKVLLD